MNWKAHLKFPDDEARLSREAKDLVGKLLCNVNQRLGASQIKVSFSLVFSCIIVQVEV